MRRAPVDYGMRCTGVMSFWALDENSLSYLQVGQVGLNVILRSCFRGFLSASTKAEHSAHIPLEDNWSSVLGLGIGHWEAHLES